MRIVLMLSLVLVALSGCASTNMNGRYAGRTVDVRAADVVDNSTPPRTGERVRQFVEDVFGHSNDVDRYSEEAVDIVERSVERARRVNAYRPGRTRCFQVYNDSPFLVNIEAPGLSDVYRMHPQSAERIIVTRPTLAEERDSYLSARAFQGAVTFSDVIRLPAERDDSRELGCIPLRILQDRWGEGGIHLEMVGRW